MASGEIPVHSPLVLPKPIPDLAVEEFQLFQALVLRESGIHLGEKNRAMLVSRLWKRLRALELNSFSAYYRRVKADPEEMVLMLDCICTNETHFFREPKAFECLRSRVFPEWVADADAGRRGKTIRVWSAACSTGEEAYSLAMTILTYFPAIAGWKVEVLGTDLGGTRDEQTFVWHRETSMGEAGKCSTRRQAQDPSVKNARRLSPPAR